MVRRGLLPAGQCPRIPVELYAEDLYLNGVLKPGELAVSVGVRVTFDPGRLDDVLIAMARDDVAVDILSRRYPALAIYARHRPGFATRVRNLIHRAWRGESPP